MQLILEILALIFIKFIFNILIVESYRFVAKRFDVLRRKLLGLPPKPLTKREQIERDYLYKDIKLTEDINPKIKEGMKGVVLEIVNNKTVYAEFLDDFGNQIEYDDELAFKIKMNQFELMPNQASND